MNTPNYGIFQQKTGRNAAMWYANFDTRVGTGDLQADGFAGETLHFGPELGFGWILGDAESTLDTSCKSPMLLVKAAYGGRSLAVDFRPPSSGIGNFDEVLHEDYGRFYNKMMDEIQSSLLNIQDLVPGYDSLEGFDLAGFVWFQGWNDYIDHRFVQEYEYNLANLIRDVRDELQAPDLSFVIGGMGQFGEQDELANSEYFAMQEAQRAVTLYKDFSNNTLYVPTALYMDHPGDDDDTTYNRLYHYNGRADVYWKIGSALGRGMVDLLQQQQVEDEQVTR